MAPHFPRRCSHQPLRRTTTRPLATRLLPLLALVFAALILPQNALAAQPAGSGWGWNVASAVSQIFSSFRAGIQTAQPTTASATSSVKPAATGTCDPSSLSGYTSSIALASGLRLHWAVTATSTIQLAVEATRASGAGTGWFAVAWASSPGAMAPSDAVMCNLATTPAIKAYRITGYAASNVAATSTFTPGSVSLTAGTTTTTAKFTWSTGDGPSVAVDVHPVDGFTRSTSDGSSVAVDVAGVNSLIWAFSASVLTWNCIAYQGFIPAHAPTQQWDRSKLTPWHLPVISHHLSPSSSLSPDPPLPFPPLPPASPLFPLLPSSFLPNRSGSADVDFSCDASASATPAPPPPATSTPPPSTSAPPPPSTSTPPPATSAPPPPTTSAPPPPPSSSGAGSNCPASTLPGYTYQTQLKGTTTKGGEMAPSDAVFGNMTGGGVFDPFQRCPNRHPSLPSSLLPCPFYSLLLHWKAASASQLDLAIEATAAPAKSGWIALAWAKGGKMAPSDAVFGNMAGGGVAAYKIGGYSMGSIQRTTAFSIGTANTTTTASGSTVVKFSRTQGTGSAAKVQVAGSNSLLWAYSPSGSKSLGFHGGA
ncbi:unnamed protein product [Closterium sp. Naga37s-1]|nr:unnamed protein product [Closterium sp. Naga37s-1]